MLVFSVENLLDVKDEIEPLIRDNWQEMSFDETVELEPDWDVYALLINANQFLFISAREEGKLVGYSAYTIMPRMLHHKQMSAADSDVFFLLPSHRKGMAAIRMLKYAEDVLREIGVDAVFSHVKAGDRDVGGVLERIGFILIEREYFKWLKK